MQRVCGVGRLQAIAPADQQGVAEHLPQAREHHAHRRLADADLGRRAADVALTQQRVETAQILKAEVRHDPSLRGRS